MTFSAYLYFALLYTAIMVAPGAAKAFVVSWRHYRDVKHSNPTATEISAHLAVLIGLGITLHAVEEVLYKAGRVWQYFQGVDTLDGATIILDVAAVTGIASLSLAAHYLNHAHTTFLRVYWAGHAVVAAVCLCVA